LNYGYSSCFPCFLKSKLILFVSLFFAIFPFPFSVHAFSEKTHRYIIQADQELVEENYENAISKYLKGLVYASWKEKIEVWDDLGFAYLKKGVHLLLIPSFFRPVVS